MHYTLKDHQGNLTATIHGNTVERMLYDNNTLKRKRNEKYYKSYYSCSSSGGFGRPAVGGMPRREPNEESFPKGKC